MIQRDKCPDLINTLFLSGLWPTLFSYLNPQDIASLYELNKKLNDLFGQKPPDDELNRKRTLAYSQIFVGSYQTFVLLRRQSNLMLFAAGQNSYGELGIGQYFSMNTNLFSPCFLPKEIVCIDGIKAGLKRTIIWGRNKNNQLMLFLAGSNNANEFIMSNDRFLKPFLVMQDLNNYYSFSPGKLPERLIKINGIKLYKSAVLIHGEDQFNRPLLVETNHPRDSNQYTFLPLPSQLRYIIDVQRFENSLIIYGRDKDNQFFIAMAGDYPFHYPDTRLDNHFYRCVLPEGITTIEGGCISHEFSFIYGHDDNRLPLVFAVGENTYGQLSTGDTKQKLHFTPCLLPPDLAKINTIESGGSHVIINGRNKHNQPFLAATGDNRFGQLGVGDNEYKTQFIHVPLPAVVKHIDKVEPGVYHTAVTARDPFNRRLVLTTGYNAQGQLVTADYEDKNKFTFIKKPVHKLSINQRLNFFTFKKPKENITEPTSLLNLRPRSCL
ncbi:hypothetical protein [Legionella fairfieldensis]|uniref:hypothetical protein n=1 Tax=Legionella fairfieldensis TaxID=45064 RepID=UPI00048C5B76|nr:hypothetical protein [Legionella fairfieldensis]